MFTLSVSCHVTCLTTLAAFGYCIWIVCWKRRSFGACCLLHRIFSSWIVWQIPSESKFVQDFLPWHIPVLILKFSRQDKGNCHSCECGGCRSGLRFAHWGSVILNWGPWFLRICGLFRQLTCQIGNEPCFQYQNDVEKYVLCTSCNFHIIRLYQIYLLSPRCQSLNIRLQAMNPFRTGKLVLFQVTYDRDWHFFEIIFFVILGIFGVNMKFSFLRSDIWSNTSHI